MSKEYEIKPKMEQEQWLLEDCCLVGRAAFPQSGKPWWMGWTASQLHSYCEKTVYLLPQEHPGTHLINFEKMKDWVNLGANQWFWTWDTWIGNPAL